jgi:hypothetical protein
MSATVKAPEESRSKIGRLPFADRMAFNRMVRDGFKGRALIAWLEEHGVAGVNAENLRKYRHSPAYRAWLFEEALVDRDRAAAENSMRLAEALGGSASDKLKSILAGKLYPLLSAIGSSEDVGALVPALRAVTEAEKLDLQRQTVAQRDALLELERKKFQRQSIEMFLKWRADKRVLEIADNDAIPEEDRTNQLGRAIFGEDW